MRDLVDEIDRLRCELEAAREEAAELRAIVAELKRGGSVAPNLTKWQGGIDSGEIVVKVSSWD